MALLVALQPQVASLVKESYQQLIIGDMIIIMSNKEHFHSYKQFSSPRLWQDEIVCEKSEEGQKRCLTLSDIESKHFETHPILSLKNNQISPRGNEVFFGGEFALNLRKSLNFLENFRQKLEDCFLNRRCLGRSSKNLYLQIFVKILDFDSYCTNKSVALNNSFHKLH